MQLEATLALAVGLALGTALPAQDELIAQRDAKLQSPFLKNGDWLTDYDQALAAAKKSGKPIFGYFTRSYAFCPPCSSLEKGALSTAAFAEFGKDVVLFCHITSHVESDPHQELLMEKGGNAFPYLVFMDPEGEVVLRYEGERDPEAIAKVGRRVAHYVELASKGEAASTADRVALLEAKLDLDLLRYLEARRQLDALLAVEGFHELVTEAELAAINQQMVNLEFNDFVAELQELRDQQQAIAKAAEKILAMRRDGRVPDGYSGMTFWNLLMYHAEEKKDLALLGEAAKNLEKLLDPADPRQRREISAIAERLEKAKAW